MFLINQLILSESLAWTLLHSLWQASVLVVLYILILNLFRPKKAEIRYALAVCTLLTIFLASSFTFWRVHDKALERHHEEIAMEEQAYDEAAFSRYAFYKSLRENDKMVEEESQSTLDFIKLWLPLISWMWLIGFFVFSLKWILSYSYVQNLRFRQSKILHIDWQNRINTLARRAGIQQTLLLKESNNIDTPMVIGHLKPVILLPASLLTGLSPNQLDAVLAHELAHIIRHDFLVNLLLSMLETIFFFHPAVWWLSERIRQEREHCADDMAVEITENKKEYAEALAIVASHSIHSPKMAMTMNGNKKYLLDRIKRLFKPDTNPARLNGRAVFGLLVVLGFSTLAMVSPEAAKNIRLENWAGNQSFYENGLTAWMHLPEREAVRHEIPRISIEKAEEAEEDQISEIRKWQANPFIYSLARVDSPPPTTNLRAFPSPPRLDVPSPPVFPPLPDMSAILDTNMTEAERKAFEEKMEAWGEEFSKGWEEWGQEFGKKWEEEYGKEVQDWAKKFSEASEEEWRAWGEELAVQMENSLDEEELQRVMEDLKVELEDLHIELDEKRIEIQERKREIQREMEHNQRDMERQQRELERTQRELERDQREIEREAQLREREARQLEMEVRKEAMERARESRREEARQRMEMNKASHLAERLEAMLIENGKIDPREKNTLTIKGDKIKVNGEKLSDDEADEYLEMIDEMGFDFQKGDKITIEF
jgi:bla regulator protein BlaR1